MESENLMDREVTEEEFNKIINNSHKVVVVEFFAEWSMPCLMLSPIIEDLAQQLTEIKFVKINKDDNQKLTEKYNVASLPCILVFKEGKEAERILGQHSAEIIEKKVRAHLN